MLLKKIVFLYLVLIVEPKKIFSIGILGVILFVTIPVLLLLLLSNIDVVILSKP